MSALPTKRDISWSVQMWLPQILLLRPSAIGPMESARYQGYEQRGASSAFQRVIWNIKRQNIFVCFSNVIHVTIHGTSLTCDLRLRCSRRCARLGYRCQSIKFCAFGPKTVLISQKGLEIMGRQPLKALRYPCPLWINSRHCGTSNQCLLCPQKRTRISRAVMSALCQ